DEAACSSGALRRPLVAPEREHRCPGGHVHPAVEAPGFNVERCGVLDAVCQNATAVEAHIDRTRPWSHVDRFRNARDDAFPGKNLRKTPFSVAVEAEDPGAGHVVDRDDEARELQRGASVPEPYPQ